MAKKDRDNVLDDCEKLEDELIIEKEYYMQAYANEMNLQTFTEIAQDFYYATSPDGYEALYALRDLFETQTEKRKIVELLIAEEEGEDGSSNIRHN